MANEPNKSQKKDTLKKWKGEQRPAARARLPLPDDKMLALFNSLDVELPKQGCDHTLRITRAWLIDQQLPLEAVIAWLHDNGGHCDCEALANSEERWREAIHD